jgi:Secretion system C-terminal sorting domain
MKTLITFFGILLMVISSYAQNIPSLIPKWYSVEKDTTFKDKSLVFSGFPILYKQDKDHNIYSLSYTTFGYQLNKIDTKTGKKLWSVARNQSFGTENKVYFPKDFFFGADGNIVLLAVKGSKFPALFAGGSVMKCVYNAQTGKELYSFIEEKKGGSAVTNNNGALEKQIIEKQNPRGYYYSDGIGGPKIMTWIRTVDTNFIAKDTLWIKLPTVDTSKGMQLSTLSPFHQINGKFYQMSAHFGGNDTSRLRTYFTKIDYQTKKYSVIDVSKYWFHGLEYISFDPTKDGFVVSLQADTAYGPTQGLDYKPNIVLAKVDTNGTLKWRTYLFPKQNPYDGFCQVVEDNKTDGYWVVLSSQTDSVKPFLYYMNQKGNLKLIGGLMLPDQGFNFYSDVPTMLSNGDILVNYRTQSKNAHPIYGKSGTLYFERKPLEALIIQNKEVVVTVDNVKVYPNPTTQSVELLLPYAIGFEYVLTDISGKMIKKENIIPTNLYSIEMGNLSGGVYFLSVKTNDNQIFTKKIVKQ